MVTGAFVATGCSGGENCCSASILSFVSTTGGSCVSPIGLVVVLVYQPLLGHFIFVFQ